MAWWFPDSALREILDICLEPQYKPHQRRRWRELKLHTLPATIAKLTAVKHLYLYSSALVRLALLG